MLRFIAEYYGHGENNLFDSFMYINEQYSSFFQSFEHQTDKEIQNKTMSTVNRMYGATPCFVYLTVSDYGHFFLQQNSLSEC